MGMSNARAIEIATKIASGRATITYHRGVKTSDRAVRISGCDLSVANDLGHQIAAVLPRGAYRQADGFACVWFDNRVSDDERQAMQDAEIEFIRSQA